MDPNLKVCSQKFSENCVITGPASKFYKGNCCKPCNAAKALEYYHNNKVKILPRQKQRYHILKPLKDRIAQHLEKYDDTVQFEIPIDTKVDLNKTFLEFTVDGVEVKEKIDVGKMFNIYANNRLKEIITTNDNPEVEDRTTIDKFNPHSD